MTQRISKQGLPLAWWQLTPSSVGEGVQLYYYFFFQLTSSCLLSDAAKRILIEIF